MEEILTSQDLRLTPLEVRLIHFFSHHPHEVVSRERLIETIWRNRPHTTFRIVDVAISKLRRKLDRRKVRLITVYGDGYRWMPQSASN